MTYTPLYTYKMLQEYYKEIIDDYRNWMRAEPKRFRFIKHFIWACKEPDFSTFLYALDHYEGELE